jgi:hypothetical protein
MKLFSAYKNIVAEIKPNLVWFTTFNLNIELVERFLLPCLVGKEPSELRTAEDYEALNLEIKDYNIKVWHDFKAISFQNDKRTTIDIEAVDAGSLLQNQTNDLIFHPKVIFLKGDKSAYIIVGSANLSVAAWHSNRECFLIKEVFSKKNALEIIQFFQSINPSQKGIKDLQKWGNTLTDIDTGWSFRHNFNMQSNLLNELSAKKLTVWSPYFSKETSKLINELKKMGISEITLVPDIDQSGKVRIIPQELQILKNDVAIAICKDESKQEAQGLVHAKIWLTEKSIAIGSWNCSFRATGISTAPNQRNIEAGIIADILSKENKALLNNLTPVAYNSISGIVEEELDAEWASGLQNYSMTCQIVADWETFTYEVIEQEFKEKYWVCLPDAPNNKVELSNLKGRSFLKHHLNVLKNKLFTVYNDKGELVYAGYIIEQGKANRPPTSYISLLDLFESLIIDPLGETTQKRVRYSLDEENTDTDNDTIPFFSYSGHESNYMMFVSFQKLQDSIYANSTNAIKLDALGFRLPGSIINIITLVDESVKKSLVEGKEDDLLFHYFLCTEVNQCIDLFNDYSLKKIEKINMNELSAKLNLSKQDNRFLKMVN